MFGRSAALALGRTRVPPDGGVPASVIDAHTRIAPYIAHSLGKLAPT